jgi:hypothetical protein
LAKRNLQIGQVLVEIQFWFLEAAAGNLFFSIFAVFALLPAGRICISILKSDPAAF